MLPTLPEAHDPAWAQPVQELWMERALLRLVFENEVDEHFDRKYRELLAHSDGDKNDQNKDYAGEDICNP